MEDTSSNSSLLKVSEGKSFEERQELLNTTEASKNKEDTPKSLLEENARLRDKIAQYDAYIFLENIRMREKISHLEGYISLIEENKSLRESILKEKEEIKPNLTSKDTLILRQR